MVTVGENGVEGEIVSEVTMIDRSDPKNVVEELIGIVEYVKTIGEYRRTQKKECSVLVRRLKLMLPFFEEIRDLETPIPESAIECLEKLKKTFHSAKKLLTTCHRGSKIYLVIFIASFVILSVFAFLIEKLYENFNCCIFNFFLSVCLGNNLDFGKLISVTYLLYRH